MPKHPLLEFIFGDDTPDDHFDATDHIVAGPRGTPVFLTGLAQWLRAAGLPVIEYYGWQQRARGSGGYQSPAPLCVMWHHTASNPSSDGQQDADYCAVYAQDAPLANLYIQRDGTVWVLAAGATNTNGKGKSMSFSRGVVPADSMNTNAVGIEVANNGVGEAWPQVQIDAFFAVSNAVNAHLRNRPDDVASHAEYAPDRKIDPATAHAVQGPWKPRSINSSGTWNPDDIRTECCLRADNQPMPPQPTGDMMYTILSIEGAAFGGMMDSNGIAGTLSWLSPPRFDACVNQGAPILELARNALANCDLIGPIPPQFTRSDFANVVP